MLRTALTCGLFAMLPVLSGCCTVAGAAIGGAGGTGVGFTVGLFQGKPSEGAATGATAGAIGGACVGAVCDAALLSPFWLPKAIAGRSESGGLSADDLIAMKQGGASDDVLIRQIEISGMRRPPTPSEVIRLAEHQVGNQVILAMQQHGRPTGVGGVATRVISTEGVYAEETPMAHSAESRSLAQGMPPMPAGPALPPVPAEHFAHPPGTPYPARSQAPTYGQPPHVVGP